MIRFEQPLYLWGFFLVPMVWLARNWFLRQGSGRWARWSRIPRDPLAPAGAAFGQKAWLALALCLIPLVLANPQWGSRTTTQKVRSTDIQVLLDISASMLAEDVPPSRLERARQLTLQMTEGLRTERIGLVFFAGNAYVQSPLTTDWQAIRLFLQAADPSQAGTQGTAIGEAVRLVLRKNEADSVQGGIILLVTDGEDHDEDAVDAVTEAADAGWVTHVVGVGTAEGGPIPVMTQRGREVKRDESGQPVTTRMNEDLLRSIARAGGGDYLTVGDDEAVIRQIRMAVDAFGQRRSTQRVFTEKGSYYAVALLPLILVILILLARPANPGKP